MDGVRADVWVWAARLAKTRSQATAACKSGHIKINDVSAKPAQLVRIDDVVKSTLHSSVKIYRVKGFATKRGNATAASALFEDLTPPPLPKPEQPAAVLRDPGTGRPSKKERRQLDALRGFTR